MPDGANFDADTQTFSWTPRYDQAGVYTVHFEVSDGELADSEDIAITVVQLYEDWDVNGDGAANVLDMVLVGQHWGETGLTGWIREDANEDGTVNVLDMTVIGQHWTE
ncbi:dockerin type I domain-containing protein [Chloroflexota bacterium]